MNVAVYNRANNYAWVLNNHLCGTTGPKDMVHDAYLRWYDKTGNDLFNEPIYRIFKIIKLTFLSDIRKNHRYWQYQGEELPSYTQEFDNQKVNRVTPEDEYIQSEVKKNCHLKVKELSEISNSRISGRKSRIMEVYELLEKGFKRNEIAEELNLTRPAITHYSNQLKYGTNTKTKEYPSC